MSSLVCRACGQATPIAAIPVSGRCPKCQSPLPLGEQGGGGGGPSSGGTRVTGNVSMIPPHLRGLMASAPPPPAAPTPAPTTNLESASPPEDGSDDHGSDEVPASPGGVPDVPPPSARRPVTAPRPALPAGVVLPAASFDRPASALPKPRTRVKSGVGLAGGVVGCLLVLVGGPLIGLLLYVMAARQDLFAIRTGPPPEGGDVVRFGGSLATSQPVQYADASRRRTQSYDGVGVKVDRVERGPVLARGPGGAILADPDGDYLVVHLTIANQSPVEDLPIRSWHGQTFPGGPGPVEAELRDAAGRPLPPAKVPGAVRLEGQTPEQAVRRNRTVTDTLIFRPPGGTLAGPLRLDLPGLAVGRNAVYRFEIPTAMIGAPTEPPGRPTLPDMPAVSEPEPMTP